jgi:very-short-patch-repair endonuclease
MTREEKHLWYDFLSKYPIRFRRQEIINNYIVDFYCHKAKLVIEIDGLQHCDSDAVVVYDEKRTEYLKSLGLEVLRIPNIDIKQSFDDVCIEIERIVTERIEKIENKSSKLKPPL